MNRDFVLGIVMALGCGFMIGLAVGLQSKIDEQLLNQAASRCESHGGMRSIGHTQVRCADGGYFEFE